MDTGELIRSLTDELEQHTIEIRHEIHANPELSFHEFATSRIVCRELDRIGVPYEESPCKPGIIATIDSGKPGKFLMLRPIWMHCQFRKRLDFPSNQRYRE